MKQEQGKESNEDKWVNDSSLDYKGNTPLRSSTGAWKASLFILTIEFSERLSYFGIATNLISYLTKVMDQDLKTAAKNVNYWGGVSTMMPLVGGFLADAYTGRFLMIIISSLIYLMGLSILTLSEFIPSIKACNTTICLEPRKIHEIIFFVALYFLSLGTGGVKPCLESFGADQFDDNHTEERKKKMSYFNWWNVALSIGYFLGVTVIVYVQDNVDWGIALLILTLLMTTSVVTFYFGRSRYRYRSPEGSPLTPMLQVLVAAIRKRRLAHPSNASLLYEASNNGHGRLLGHTNRLRFLDKAAIIEEKDQILSNGKKQNPWKLSTLTKVEETKLFLNIIPIWLTSLIFGMGISLTTTFFVKQGATMNRKIGQNFQIPPASINFFTPIGIIFSVTIYEKILVPILRKYTGNERGISILKRIGIGMIFSVIGLITAALVEIKRLKIVNEEKHVPLSISVFWLAPQYIILGIGDGFTLVGLQEYFYDQVPDSMRSLGIAFYLSVLGIGHFLTNFVIIIVNNFSEKYGKSWIGKDLKSSRIDHFYWVLAVLNLLNLFGYVILARRYTYKNVKDKIVRDCSNKDLELS